MTEECDVLIVGGGPAGLAAAEAAAKLNARTVLLERQNEIGYPVHTSGGSWISDMKALAIPENLYHPITKVVFVSPNCEVPLHYHPAVACVLDVRGVYQHLAGRAIAAGATLRVRHAVDTTMVENDRIVGVTAKNHVSERISVRASVTVDASGFSRHVGVRTGMGKAFQRYGYGAEYDLYAPNYPQDELFLIMGSSYAPRGYAWAFPRGNGRVRLGVGVLHPDCDDDARAYLDRIVHDLPQLSGQLAGSIATEAVKAGDTSAAYLERFDKQWRARFGRDMDIAYMINKHIANYSDGQWDSALDLMKRLTPAQMALALRGDF